VRPRWLRPPAGVRLPLRPVLAGRDERRSSGVGVRIDAPARDRPFGHCEADSAPPVRSSARFSRERAASGVVSRRDHDRPDASLEVLVPFSARWSRRASRVLPCGPGDPASIFRRTRRLLARGCFCSLPPPTHRRRPLTLAVLRLVQSGGPSTPRGSTPRVLAGTLRRLATRRCIGRVAPAVWVMRRPLFRAAFRYPHAGHVAWSGPFRRRSVLGFPSRDQLLRATGDLACLAHRTRVTRVTVLLSTLFPDGTRGVSDVRALRRFAPARRMRRCFQRREPTCRSPIHPSQWFRCAIGRPGSMQGAPVVVPRFERRASSAAKRWE
jgi:hypothetical protein